MSFHRENKNRPREMSSKYPVPMFREVFSVKKRHCRDPRFDDLSGTFNAEEFEENYSFLKDIKEREKKSLQKELKRVENPKKKSQILSILRKMKNEEKSLTKNKAEKAKETERRAEMMAAAEQGKKPYFPKKSEVKMNEMVEQYKTLKDTGKLDKYLEKKRKKQFCKDKKRFYNK